MKIPTESDTLSTTDEANQERQQHRGRQAHRHRARPLPPPKVSYEASSEVQSWLRAQELERAGTKPAFEPSFLAGQRDRPWVLSSLTAFYEDDLIADVLGVVKSGKEATVYCCAAGPAAGMDYAAAKVYRPRMFRSLKNDALYRESRPIYDAGGFEVRSRREVRGALKKTERGRATEVASWIAYEFQTQRLLYDAGGDVPRALAQMGNALLMAYIGEPGAAAAPLLAHVRLDPDEARPLFERVLRNVELFLSCGRVHGDLSAYNIVYWQGEITIIDFAQSVDPRYSPAVYGLLERDVARVCRYFARYGIEANPRELARELWTRYAAAGPR